MPAPKRVTTVQVPGETAEQSDGQVTEADVGLAEESIAQAAPAPRKGRAQYAHMRGHEVDASTLTSAVLTKDGWVAPHPKAKA